MRSVLQHREQAKDRAPKGKFKKTSGRPAGREGADTLHSCIRYIDWSTLGRACCKRVQALQERRCLGILHGLGLRSCILYGPGLYPFILLPDICSAFPHTPDDLCCPRMMHGPGPSLLLRRSHRCWGIFHDRCWGILYGLGQCPRILLGGPGPELPKQGF
jgi:hypothetical protein